MSESSSPHYSEDELDASTPPARSHSASTASSASRRPSSAAGSEQRAAPAQEEPEITEKPAHDDKDPEEQKEKPSDDDDDGGGYEDDAESEADEAKADDKDPEKQKEDKKPSDDDDDGGSEDGAESEADEAKAPDEEIPDEKKSPKDSADEDGERGAEEADDDAKSEASETKQADDGKSASNNDKTSQKSSRKDSPVSSRASSARSSTSSASAHSSRNEEETTRKDEETKSKEVKKKPSASKPPAKKNPKPPPKKDQEPSKKLEKTKPVDPLARYQRQATLTEINQLLHDHQEEEQITRSEIFLDEALGFESIVARSGRSLKARDRRDDMNQQKHEAFEARVAETYRQRKLFMEKEEQKSRQVIITQEQLQLEAKVRILEKDIQADVYDESYQLSQRTKYFNKTMAVILKNEATDRKQIFSSQRYEWLVLMQHCDSEAAKQLIADRLSAYKDKQQQIISAFRETRRDNKRLVGKASTVNSRSSDRGKTPSSRGGSKASRRRRDKDKIILGPRNVPSRTTMQHNEDYWARASQVCEEREQAARHETHELQRREWDAILRVILYHDQQWRAIEEHKGTKAEREQAHVAHRRFKEIDKTEGQERYAVTCTERGEFKAIRRHWERLLIAESRRAEANEVRHMTHQRKLDDRQHRMLFHRAAFEKKHDILVNDVRPKEGFLPVFVPKPPDMVEAVRDELELSELRTKLRVSVQLRSLQSQQQAARVAIEKEERLLRFNLGHDFGDGPAVAEKRERDAMASQRRLTLQVEQQNKVATKIVDKMDQRERTHRQRAEQKKLQQQQDKLAKEELAARKDVTAEERAAAADLQRAIDAVVGKRVFAAFDTVVESEAKDRHTLVQMEQKVRASLKASMAAHRPQSRIVYITPLPPPKSKYDIPGFLSRPSDEGSLSAPPPGSRSQSTMSQQRKSGVTSRASATTTSNQSRNGRVVKATPAPSAQESNKKPNTPPPEEKTEEEGAAPKQQPDDQSQTADNDPPTENDTAEEKQPTAQDPSAENDNGENDGDDYADDADEEQEDAENDAKTKDEDTKSSASSHHQYSEE